MRLDRNRSNIILESNRRKIKLKWRKKEQGRRSLRRCSQTEFHIFCKGTVDPESFFIIVIYCKPCA